MTDTNHTATNEEMEESEDSTVKESFKDLLVEIASSALSAAGKVLHTKYSTERVDGKPRKTVE